MQETAFFGRVEAWGNEVKIDVGRGDKNRRRQSLRRTRLYSSASNYEGQGGLIKVQLLEEMYQVGGIVCTKRRFLDVLRRRE